MENQKLQSDIPQQHKNWFLSHEFIYSVIGILLLVVVLGAVNWWRFEIRTAKELTIGLLPVHKQQSAVPSDWKTYQNIDCGIEFKYPKELTMGLDKKENCTAKEATLMITLDTAETLKALQAPMLDYRLGDIILEFDPNPENLPVEVFYTGQNTEFKNTQKIKIGNNINAYRFVCGAASDAVCIFVAADKKFFGFHSFMGQETLDQILSTFKFL